MNGFNLSNIQNAMLGSTQVSALYYGSKLIWEKFHNYSLDYFTIEATTDYGADVLVKKNGSQSDITLSYSKDLINWTDYTVNSTSLTEFVFLLKGEKLYIKSTNTSLSEGSSQGLTICAYDPYIIYGNIMSLLYGDNFVNQTTLTDHFSFANLFNNSGNGLTDASNLILPATTLTGYCYSQMFQGCTSLTSAPALPATTLYMYCYNNMFQGCTSLTTAPALPATTLYMYCYNNMFQGCTSLTTAPALPATTLADYCYYEMFRGCTSLTTAPALPATTLAGTCYGRMFYDCTSLTTAPALPATTLEVACYRQMFRGCTSLTTAPALPATTLTESCYHSMFQGCTSLTTAPTLPATTLEVACYRQMFSGCTSLMYIKALATDISANNSHVAFTSGVNTTGGTFVKPSSMTSWPTGQDGIPSGWNVSNIYNVNIDNSIVGGTITSNIAYALPNETIILTVTPDPHCTLQSLTVVDANDNPVTVTNNQFTMPNSNVTVSAVFNINYNEMYFTIESLANNNEVYFETVASNQTALSKSIEYSTDLTNWTLVTDALNVNASPFITLSQGQKVYLRGSNSTYAISMSVYDEFYCTQNFNLSGNIMSLIYKSNFKGQTTLINTYTFACMFRNSGSKLTSITNLVLPATKLANYCYFYMFRDCTSLTTTPVLPATTLADACYHSMFYGCTSLTTAPALPATKLAANCYTQMFFGCSSLTSAPALPATTLANYCYQSMFRNCTSLTSAPVLPATKLVNYCYREMFSGCTSLMYIKTLATNISATKSHYLFTQFVNTTGGTFVKPSSMTSWPTGQDGIPSGWTVVNV